MPFYFSDLNYYSELIRKQHLEGIRSSKTTKSKTLILKLWVKEIWNIYLQNHFISCNNWKCCKYKFKNISNNEIKNKCTNRKDKKIAFGICKVPRTWQLLWNTCHLWIVEWCCKFPGLRRVCSVKFGTSTPYWTVLAWSPLICQSHITIFNSIFHK